MYNKSKNKLIEKTVLPWDKAETDSFKNRNEETEEGEIAVCSSEDDRLLIKLYMAKVIIKEIWDSFYSTFN